MTEIQGVEVALLGMMLSYPEAIDTASELPVGDLYLDSHRRIFTVIGQMHARDEQATIVTLLAELNRLKLTDAVGGAGYISDLTNDAHRGADVGHYIRLIKKEAARRQIIALAALMAARAEGGDDPEQIYADLQTSALEAQAANVLIRPMHISELVKPALERMKQQRQHTGEVLGIPTGIAELDCATTGWREGELTYLGAYPGRGKTSFMLQSMHHAASKGIGVGCISLEMRGQQLMSRLATIESKMPAYKFRDPRTMNLGEEQHARHSLIRLGDLGIQICDQASLNPSAIASLARQMHARGAYVIYVDFVQIIHEDGRDRREAINRVSAALRDTSKSLGIPFVVASQLARRSDMDLPPKMSDLRESGNLEQDAHNVLMLHRMKDKMGEWTGEDFILIEKQREGMTGSVNVTYDGDSLTFKPRNPRVAA